MTAFQRMGDPAELGAAAAFLASSDSSFMTASEVAVDGGLAQLRRATPGISFDYSERRRAR
jgi:NAD(P)-dependent dehydrogenase (short-subunit alcohol dehydrogenase family)